MTHVGVAAVVLTTRVPASVKFSVLLGRKAYTCPVLPTMRLNSR